jgi:hypothetical protein
MEARVFHDIPPLAIFLALFPEMGHVTASMDINNFFHAAFSRYSYKSRTKYLRCSQIYSGMAQCPDRVVEEYSHGKSAWNIANVAAIALGVSTMFLCAALILPPTIAGLTIFSISISQYAAILSIIGMVSLSIKAYVCRFDEKLSQHQGEDWNKAMEEVRSSGRKPKTKEESSSSESASEYPNDL